jgi:hypothetical protein
LIAIAPYRLASQTIVAVDPVIWGVAWPRGSGSRAAGVGPGYHVFLADFPLEVGEHKPGRDAGKMVQHDLNAL